MAGTNDAVVPPAERTFPAFTAAPPPSPYWELDRVGHNGFDDFCTFGNGAGIIGVAESSGLGGLLVAQPDLRRLGTDGCLEPNAPVTDGYPVAPHAATAWIRALFAIDTAPVGLGPEVAGAYPVTVVIESKER